MKEDNEITGNSIGNGTEINSLMHRLQKEDTRNRMIFKRFHWIFMAFIIVYSFLFIFNPFEETGWPDRIIGICYVLAFLFFGWIFRKYYRDYASIDYSLPVAEMLQKAVQRYQLQYRKTWIVIFPLLLIDAGTTLSFFPRLSLYSAWERIGLVQLIYIPTLIIATLIGVLIWYKRQKPLRDEARKLLDELK